MRAGSALVQCAYLCDGRRSETRPHLPPFSSQGLPYRPRRHHQPLAHTTDVLLRAVARPSRPPRYGAFVRSPRARRAKVGWPWPTRSKGPVARPFSVRSLRRLQSEVSHRRDPALPHDDVPAHQARPRAPTPAQRIGLEIRRSAGVGARGARGLATQTLRPNLQTPQ